MFLKFWLPVAVAVFISGGTLALVLTSTTQICEGLGCGEDEVASPDDTIIGSISDPAAPNVTSQLVGAESGTPNATVGIGDSSIEGITVADVASAADLATDSTDAPEDEDSTDTNDETTDEDDDDSEDEDDDPEDAEDEEDDDNDEQDGDDGETEVVPPAPVVYDLLTGTHTVPFNHNCILFARNDESSSVPPAFPTGSPVIQLEESGSRHFDWEDEPFEENTQSYGPLTWPHRLVGQQVDETASFEVAQLTCQLAPKEQWRYPPENLGGDLDEFGQPFFN